MAFSSFSFVKPSLTSLFLISSLLFFLLFPPKPISHKSPILPHRSLFNASTVSSLPCSSIHQIPPHQRCPFSLHNCNGDSNGLFNYPSLHFCVFNQNPHLSIPSLSLILLLQFYFLVKTAQDRFSVVVTKLSAHLNLSPSMGAVTLLALGNGAPDVFASAAAVRGGHARTGLGAILSAGTFVSALVVGFVAIYAAPFAVNPAPFVRDVFFYLIAALSLFYVYLSGEIYIWQAVGFVGFYVFFVGFVFWMDVGEQGRKGDCGEDVEMMSLMGNAQKGFKVEDWESGGQLGSVDGDKTQGGFAMAIQKMRMTVLTDGDKGMRKAIENVWNNVTPNLLLAYSQ